jgi:hypothetical protein
MLSLVYQRPEDLILNVLTGEIQPALKVLKQQVVMIHDWRFVFAIIGESHWIRIERHNRLVLQEVLACIPVRAEGSLFYHRCTEALPTSYRWARYDVALHFSASPSPGLPEAEGRLALDFPPLYGIVPTTQIAWKQQAGALHWWTRHTYPGPAQLTYVRTHSTFHTHEEVQP